MAKPFRIILIILAAPATVGMLWFTLWLSIQFATWCEAQSGAPEAGLFGGFWSFVFMVAVEGFTAHSVCKEIHRA